MEKALWTGLLAVMLNLSASGAVYEFNSGFQNGQVVPDGDLNGWADTRTVSGVAGGLVISDVQVALSVSGGFNGDLYAYLSHDGGTAILLNRAGVGQAQGSAAGYANAGMTITLATDGAGGNIHSYGGAAAPSGTYAPDGRAIAPLSSPASFDTAPTTTGLARFNTLDPNGTWTLFLADTVSGGGPATVNSWSLTITAVPEPVNATLAAFGLGVLCVGVGRRLWVWARS